MTTWQFAPGEAPAIFNPLNGPARPAPGDPAAPLPSAAPDAFQTALTRLRDAATGQGGQFSPAELDAQAPAVVDWCRAHARQIVSALNDESLSARSRLAFPEPDEQVVDALLNELFGLGPLEALLRLPEVEDIAINGPEDVWYKARGSWQRSPVQFRSSEAALVALNRAIAHTGRQAGPFTPIVDGTLRAGHRINIITAPLTEPWPVASLRLHRDRSLTMIDLVAAGGEEGDPPAPVRLPDYSARDLGAGMFTGLAAAFLHMAVVAGFNILVVGPTGVGKTTVLGALGGLIPADRRIVSIEDTRELRLRGLVNAANCVYLVTRPPTVEGLAPITQRDLVVAALRQRPDALTVGEARGPEVFDMLKALWTGHRNGLTSIHADAIGDVPNRIAMMLQEADFRTQVQEATIAHWIAKAFHLGLTLRRTESGRRYVEEIVEFTGAVEGAIPVTTTLFRYDAGRRRLACTGYQLDRWHAAQLRAAGFDYDAILTAARERREVA